MIFLCYIFREIQEEYTGLQSACLQSIWVLMAQQSEENFTSHYALLFLESDRAQGIMTEKRQFEGVPGENFRTQRGRRMQAHKLTGLGSLEPPFMCQNLTRQRPNYSSWSLPVKAFRALACFFFHWFLSCQVYLWQEGRMVLWLLANSWNLFNSLQNHRGTSALVGRTHQAITRMASFSQYSLILILYIHYKPYGFKRVFVVAFWYHWVWIDFDDIIRCVNSEEHMSGWHTCWLIHFHALFNFIVGQISLWVALINLWVCWICAHEWQETRKDL